VGNISVEGEVYWNFKNGMMNANMAIFVATLAKTICKVEQQHHLNVIKRIKVQKV